MWWTLTNQLRIHSQPQNLGLRLVVVVVVVVVIADVVVSMHTDFQFLNISMRICLAIIKI